MTETFYQSYAENSAIHGGDAERLDLSLTR